MVPENIHTPTTEGIGNSRGVGGSKAQEILERRGGGGGGGVEVVSEFTFPDGLVQCHANLFQNRFLPTLKIFYIEKIAVWVFDLF